MTKGTLSRRSFMALASGLLVPEPPRVRQYAFVEGWVAERPRASAGRTVFVDPSGALPGSVPTLQAAIRQMFEDEALLSFMLAPGDYSAMPEVAFVDTGTSFRFGIRPTLLREDARHLFKHVLSEREGREPDGDSGVPVVLGYDDRGLLKQVRAESVGSDTDDVEAELGDDLAALDADDALHVVDDGSDELCHGDEATT